MTPPFSQVPVGWRDTRGVRDSISISIVHVNAGRGEGVLQVSSLAPDKALELFARISVMEASVVLFGPLFDPQAKREDRCGPHPQTTQTLVLF